MAGNYGVLDSVAYVFVPIHRDGHKFLGVGLALVMLFFIVWPPLGWICVILTAWLAYFFRDPDRVTPLREGLIIAPSDGRVVSIDKVMPPPELGMQGNERVRISIFLSLFDMHINRAPVSGRITRSVYVPGSFLNAQDNKSSDDNERRGLIIEMPTGSEIAILQIAGMITRRIVTFAGEGDSIGVGQRFGLIRFGSRVDVYLPEGHAAMVSVGQRMVAGETVIADLKSTEHEREARRS